MAESGPTGGGYSRAPAHQNRFAYKHNKNSKITKRILAINHHGLCERCSEQIEWRKSYRKYKPLKAPAKCRGCDQRNVKRAYHTMCGSCAGGQRVCAKCVKPLSVMSLEEIEARRLRHNATKLESLIDGLREREKRAIRRQMANGEMRVESVDGVNYQLVEQDRPVKESEEGEEEEEGAGATMDEAEDGDADEQPVLEPSSTNQEADVQVVAAAEASESVDAVSQAVAEVGITTDAVDAVSEAVAEVDITADSVVAEVKADRVQEQTAE